MMAGNNLPQPRKGWVWTKLGVVCMEIIGGGTPSREIPEYFGGSIVWLTPTEVPKDKIVILNDSREKITEAGLKNSSARIIPKGSVLLTSRASIGYLAVAGCDVTTNQGFASFICPQEIYNLYLAYWLSTNKDVIEAEATGTTFKEIPKSKLREFSFPLPPLPEQHRIVGKIEEVFTKLDAAVEALKKIKAQLKRYRQAVLKSAFEGKLTQEWREKHKHELEPASVLLERIKEETKKRSKGKYKEPPPLNTSELPELPEGWIWARLGTVSEKMQYGTSEKATRDASGIPVVRMGNIQNGQLIFDNLKYFPRNPPWLDDFVLRDGDVLFNRTNSAELVGKTAVYKSHHPAAVFASYLIRIKVNRSAYTPTILSFFINSFHGRRYIASVVSQQVGQANVNATKLSSMPIPLAPLSEQQRLIEEIERRFSVIDELEKVVSQGLTQTERLRQSILKRAFEGKLVPQDPSDEPAEKLLERIKTEKAKQEKEKKIKKHPKKKLKVRKR